MTTIYKICPARLWHEAESAGIFRGAGVDLADGFIHFSTAETVRETAERHFSGVADLVLVAVDDLGLGPELRYEPSRGGVLFPIFTARSIRRPCCGWRRCRSMPAGGMSFPI